MSTPFKDQTPWGPVRLTMPFTVLPGGSDFAIIGHKTPREHFGIDVMVQLKASVLNACGRHDSAGVELTARAAGGSHADAVLRGAMALTAFGPRGDGPGDGDNNATRLNDP